MKHDYAPRVAALVAVFVAAVGAVFAVPPLTHEELAYNQKKFEVWRQFPDQLAKLRHAADRFDELPEARQRQLLELDHQLAIQPSTTQARLHSVLDRYDAWFNALPEMDRDRIRQAPDSAARLAVVRELRDAEFLRRQPRAVRERIEKLPEAERAAAVAKVRERTRRDRSEWQVARRFWDDIVRDKPLPTRLTDFDSATQTYVNEVLSRLLSKPERDRLAKAEGQWPLYPQTLVDLADKHPPALPSPDAPSTVADLPRPVRDSLKKGLFGSKEKKLKPFEGRTREFAMRLTSLAAETGIVMPMEWWASNFHSLHPAMQEFVRKMEPLLDRKEIRLLVDAEGKWPDYPETIQTLARTHNLRAPWFVLPGPSERWDLYRDKPTAPAPGYPDVPRYKLRDFVVYDLQDHDQLTLKNEIERARGNDADAWALVIERYFQRYPLELARLRQVDREAMQRKAGNR